MINENDGVLILRIFAPPPFFALKKKGIAERRKAGRASDKKPAPP